jgi:hypothetical protein
VNALQKKLGPLKAWQWVVIGGGAGAAWYLWKRSHAGSTKPEVNPEEEEKLLAALRAAGGGEGTGGGNVNPTVAAPAPAPGEPGPAGAVGIAGPPGESVNLAPLESEVSSLQQQLAQNNPTAALSHTTAPQAKKSNLTRNPANGEMYRTVQKNGVTFHEYPNRRGPNKYVRIGGKPNKAPTGHQQKPRAAKRPKPTPIHQRVTTHHVAPHRAKAKPVHHDAAPAHHAAPAPAHAAPVRHPAPHPKPKPKPRRRG